MDDEVITITSGDDDNDNDEPIELTRRDILHPIITRVVDALGGYEGTNPPTYRLGDSVLPCLSDLKKLWRKDDTDDDRTCAHIFWETRVLPNDLVPILLVLCTGQGLGSGAEDRRAIAIADLCCAMTWPIDIAAELKELDDTDDADLKIDFTQLLHSHLVYKAALLRPGVLQSLFSLLLPPLSLPPKERTPRDAQIISLVLHLIRNLAFIRDLPRDVRSSADQAELGGLQAKLVRQLEETHFLELVLVIAANRDGDPVFADLNTLVLEIFYLLVRGVRPCGLSGDLAKVCFCLKTFIPFLIFHRGSNPQKISTASSKPRKKHAATPRAKPPLDTPASEPPSPLSSTLTKRPPLLSRTQTPSNPQTQTRPPPRPQPNPSSSTANRPSPPPPSPPSSTCASAPNPSPLTCASTSSAQAHRRRTAWVSRGVGY